MYACVLLLFFSLFVFVLLLFVFCFILVAVIMFCNYVCLGF